MIRKKNSRVYEVNFSERKLKKTVAIILLIVIILGYAFYIFYNIFVIWSVTEIKISPGEFEIVDIDNETVSFEGSIEIDNSHWNSVDISDLVIDFTLLAENGTSILDDTIKKDKIPAREISTLEFEIELEVLSLGFLILNSTSDFDMDLEISFWYGLYGITLSLQTSIEVD
ncbi:MAG: hypothetical protein ACFFDB_00330 [Promethearchaeota archaeon]